MIDFTIFLSGTVDLFVVLNILTALQDCTEPIFKWYKDVDGMYKGGFNGFTRKRDEFVTSGI